MAVVIDEVVTETAEDTTRSAPVLSGGAGGGADRSEPDMDLLDYLMSWRRHRAQRLWAD